MNATASPHLTLSEEQMIFKKRLSSFPRLEPYWDFDKRECDLERLRNDLGVLSTGEAIMARFFCGVWLGKNAMDFDMIDAARTLDSKQLKVIVGWLSNPLFP